MTLTQLDLFFSKRELDRYTHARTQQLSVKSLNWILKSSQIFWNNTEGVISQNTMCAIYDYTLGKYASKDSWNKVLTFVKSFLKYLSKLHMDVRYQNFGMFLDMPKTRRERKTVTSRIVTTPDITNVINQFIDAYHNGQLSHDKMMNYVGITLFGAYTGQRVESTISNLTVGQFKVALCSTPPVLHITPIQDKIRMEHYVPVHPDLLPILTKLIEGRDENDKMFKFVGYQMWLKHHSIQLTRAPLRFTPSDLRKFAEQHGDIIQWGQSNRAYILTHGVSGVDWSHYKHPLPEHVYANYMQYWESVHLGKEIPVEITRTSGLKVAQPSAALSTA